MCYWLHTLFLLLEFLIGQPDILVRDTCLGKDKSAYFSSSPKVEVDDLDFGSHGDAVAASSLASSGTQTY